MSFSPADRRETSQVKSWAQLVANLRFPSWWVRWWWRQRSCVTGSTHRHNCTLTVRHCLGLSVVHISFSSVSFLLILMRLLLTLIWWTATLPGNGFTITRPHPHKRQPWRVPRHTPVLLSCLSPTHAHARSTRPNVLKWLLVLSALSNRVFL